MSGHSKWATIHRQKEINDSKKGAVFTRLAAAITIAVKQGRGLQLALDKAKQFNMPKESIQRAIDRATGAGGENLEEAMYEGFLPGGVAVIVQVLTDNKLRTQQQVREVLDKNGGSMAGAGAVSYMFEQVGELRIMNHELCEDDELKIIDLNIDEIIKDDGEWVIYCHKERTSEVKEGLEKFGYKVTGVELVMKPTTLIEVANPETRGKIENLLGKLEELDDVHGVWANYA